MRRVAIGLLVPVGSLVIYAVVISNLWAGALAVAMLAVAVAMLAGKD